MPVILVRRTASTSDVSLMPVIGGIITSLGGVTSHAAVLAQKFGVTAVVACSAPSFGSDGQCPYALVGDMIVREGTPISIEQADTRKDEHRSPVLQQALHVTLNHFAHQSFCPASLQHTSIFWISFLLTFT